MTALLYAMVSPFSLSRNSDPSGKNLAVEALLTQRAIYRYYGIICLALQMLSKKQAEDPFSSLFGDGYKSGNKRA
jgi:hypothetical protein